jgi:hypothetical protein
MAPLPPSEFEKEDGLSTTRHCQAGEGRRDPLTEFTHHPRSSQTCHHIVSYRSSDNTMESITATNTVTITTAIGTVYI